MPSIPRLNNCCCCLSIETGVKILGYVETIIGFLGALLYSLALGGVINLDESTSPHIEPEGNSTSTPFPTDLPKPSEDEAMTEVLVVLVIGTLFVAVVGLLLLLGAYKRNATLIKVSLIGRCVLLAYYILGFVINLIALALGHETQILAQIILFVIVTYNTLIVYSFYQDVKSGSSVY